METLLRRRRACRAVDAPALFPDLGGGLRVKGRKRLRLRATPPRAGDRGTLSLVRRRRRTRRKRGAMRLAALTLGPDCGAWPRDALSPLHGVGGGAGGGDGPVVPAA
jgi:hypothetical protein